MPPPAQPLAEQPAAAPAPPPDPPVEPPAIETAPAAPQRPAAAPRTAAPEPPAPRLHPRVAAVRRSALYEPALAALARVLGASHALRVACRGKSDQVYRARMTALLDLEAPRSEDERRTALVQAFNAAYEDEAGRTPRCDGSVARRQADFARQGRALAQRLRDLYAAAPAQTGAPE